MYAPVVYKPVTLHLRVPWFTEEIRSVKKLRRKLERKWRSTKSDFNYRLYVDHCCMVNDFVRNAKEICFSSVIENNHGNKQVYFQIINNPLLKRTEPLHPTACSDADLADQFNLFFNNKIRLIHEGLQQCELTSFDRVSTEYIATVLKSCKVESYTLDLVLASVLTGCLLVLLHVMTNLVKVIPQYCTAHNKHVIGNKI